MNKTTESHYEKSNKFRIRYYSQVIPEIFPRISHEKSENINIIQCPMIGGNYNDHSCGCHCDEHVKCLPGSNDGCNRDDRDIYKQSFIPPHILSQFNYTPFSDIPQRHDCFYY